MTRAAHPTDVATRNPPTFFERHPTARQVLPTALCVLLLGGGAFLATYFTGCKKWQIALATATGPLLIISAAYCRARRQRSQDHAEARPAAPASAHTAAHTAAPSTDSPGSRPLPPPAAPEAIARGPLIPPPSSAAVDAPAARSEPPRRSLLPAPATAEDYIDGVRFNLATHHDLGLTPAEQLQGNVFGEAVFEELESISTSRGADLPSPHRSSMQSAPPVAPIPNRSFLTDAALGASHARALQQLRDLAPPAEATPDRLGGGVALEAQEDLLPLLALILARSPDRRAVLCGDLASGCMPMTRLTTLRQRQIGRAIATDGPAAPADWYLPLLDHLRSIEAPSPRFAAPPPAVDLVIPINYNGRWLVAYVDRAKHVIEWIDPEVINRHPDVTAATTNLAHWLQVHDGVPYTIHYPLQQRVQGSGSDCGVWAVLLLALRTHSENPISDTHPDVVRHTTYRLAEARSFYGRYLNAMYASNCLATTPDAAAHLMHPLF